MTYNIIPLTTDPDQQFLITIPVDGKNINLNLRVRYNTVGLYWWMTITDPITEVIILDSIPLVTGDYPSADVLGQYAYLALGTAGIIKSGNQSGYNPDDTNLGVEYQLLWGDRA